MLKEQLLQVAMKAFSRAHETKERIRTQLKAEPIASYFHSLKAAALFAIEHKIDRLTKADPSLRSDEEKPPAARKVDNQPAVTKTKSRRKSSIKPVAQIDSQRAQVILAGLNTQTAVKVEDTISGKKTLAYLIWALGHAERAKLDEGISIHDVSSLLHRACDIEVYPINVSRVVYGNPDLVRQSGQIKRTKTYLLTPKGKEIFENKYLKNTMAK